MPNTIEIGICTKSDAFALSSLRHAHKCREQNDDENIVAGCTRCRLSLFPGASPINPKADALCYAGCSFVNNAVRQPCKHVDSLSLIIAYLLPLTVPQP